MPDRDTVPPAQHPHADASLDTIRGEGGSFWQWLRRTARLWGFFAFILVIILVFRAVILPFVLALLFAYVLAPVVGRLCRTRIRNICLPRFVWVIVVYLTVLGLGSLFVTSFVPRVSHDLKRVVRETPGLWRQVKEDWAPRVADWLKANVGADVSGQLVQQQQTPPAQEQEPPRIRLRQLATGEISLDLNDLQAEVLPAPGGGWLVRTPRPQTAESDPAPIGDAIQRYVDDLVRSSEAGSKRLFVAVQTLVTGVFSTFTTLLLVFMISFFLLLDTDRILNWLRALVPRIYQRDSDEVLRRIDKALGGAIRGQLLICLINGILTGIGLVLIGVNYAFLLALLAGIMSLIPIFGSILSTVPIVIVALVSGTGEGVHIVKGLLAVAWISGIHLLEANLLNPKIIGTAARIHPVIVIFAVVAGERTYGPIGALLAVPIVSAVQAMFIYLRARAQDDAPVSGEAGALR